MNHITIDLETYSEANLPDTGLYKYAQDPSFEILMASYHLPGEEPVQLDFSRLQDLDEPLRHLRFLLFDSSIINHAHNAAFEWWCLSEYWHLTWEERSAWLDQWQDTMIHMLYCGLPASLANAGKALNVPQDKAKDRQGKALITYFSKPCKPTKANGMRTRNFPSDDPERWELYKSYNRQDVVAEEALDDMMSAWPVPEELWQEWRDDVRMNAYGIMTDRAMALSAIQCADSAAAEMLAEAKAITGLGNPNSRAQLLDWANDRGAELPDLRKETVAAALEAGNLPPEVHRALALRLELGKTSVTKYQTVLDCTTDTSPRIRGTLQFYGANRTGRWAGRLLQVQNLPRTYIPRSAQADTRKIIKHQSVEGLRVLYGDINDTLSQMIRTVLIAPPGCKFVDADFSAIEARLIAWEAGEDWVLEVFRTTGKIYEATAARIFGVPFETIKKGQPNYAYRQKGKVATLALGYQGGVGAMKRMGGDKLGLDDTGLQDIVNRWRRQNPHIVALWGRMDKAAKYTIKTGHATAVGLNGSTAKVIFRREASRKAPYPFLTMQLPSGRKLFYANPGFLDDGRISYYEQTATGWAKSETYGGKLTENLTQALGRDCLAFTLGNLRNAGYRVVFHIHDEVVIECQESLANVALQDVESIMSRTPPWADGLPLNADGWVGDFFTKD